MQIVNVSRQLKWTLQGIFVALILCHCEIEIQYDERRIQGRGVCKVGVCLFPRMVWFY